MMSLPTSASEVYLSTLNLERYSVLTRVGYAEYSLHAKILVRIGIYFCVRVLLGNPVADMTCVSAPLILGLLLCKPCFFPVEVGGGPIVQTRANTY